MTSSASPAGLTQCVEKLRWSRPACYHYTTPPPCCRGNYSFHWNI